MSTLPSLRTSYLQSTLVAVLLCSSASLVAQSSVISADLLTPFQPRDVGTTSEVKNVRVRLNYPRALLVAA